jgi:hypothetical protein
MLQFIFFNIYLFSDLVRAFSPENDSYRRATTRRKHDNTSSTDFTGSLGKFQIFRISCFKVIVHITVQFAAFWAKRLQKFNNKNLIHFSF